MSDGAAIGEVMDAGWVEFFAESEGISAGQIGISVGDEDVFAAGEDGGGAAPEVSADEPAVDDVGVFFFDYSGEVAEKSDRVFIIFRHTLEADGRLGVELDALLVI